MHRHYPEYSASQCTVLSFEVSTCVRQHSSAFNLISFFVLPFDRFRVIAQVRGSCGGCKSLSLLYLSLTSALFNANILRFLKHHPFYSTNTRMAMLLFVTRCASALEYQTELRLVQNETSTTASSISMNTTAPNLPGPGRNLGNLFSSLGARLESFLNRCALRFGLWDVRTQPPRPL